MHLALKLLVNKDDMELLSAPLILKFDPTALPFNDTRRHTLSLDILDRMHQTIQFRINPVDRLFDRMIKVDADDQGRHFAAENGYDIREVTCNLKGTETFLTSNLNQNDYQDIILKRAFTRISLGKYEEALEDSLLAIDIKPTANPYYCNAIALQYLGRFDEAIKSYRYSKELCTSDDRDSGLSAKIDEWLKTLLEYLDEKAEMDLSSSVNDVVDGTTIPDYANMVHLYMTTTRPDKLFKDISIFDDILDNLITRPHITALVSAIYVYYLENPDLPDIAPLIVTLHGGDDNASSTLHLWSDCISFVVTGTSGISIKSHENLKRTLDFLKMLFEEHIIGPYHIYAMINRVFKNKPTDDVMYEYYCLFVATMSALLVRCLPTEMIRLYQSITQLLADNSSTMSSHAITCTKAVLEAIQHSKSHISEQEIIENSPLPTTPPSILRHHFLTMSRFTPRNGSLNFYEILGSSNYAKEIRKTTSREHIALISSFKDIKSTISDYNRLLQILPSILDTNVVVEIIEALYKEENDILYRDGIFYQEMCDQRFLLIQTLVAKYPQIRNMRTDYKFNSSQRPVKSPVVLRQMPIAVFPVISDDVESFSQLYSTDYHSNPVSLVDVAAMCGSDRVAFYLTPQDWTENSRPLWWCAVNTYDGLARMLILNNRDLSAEDRDQALQAPPGERQISEVLADNEGEDFIDECFEAGFPLPASRSQGPHDRIEDCGLLGIAVCNKSFELIGVLARHYRNLHLCNHAFASLLLSSFDNAGAYETYLAYQRFMPTVNTRCIGNTGIPCAAFAGGLDMLIHLLKQPNSEEIVTLSFSTKSWRDLYLMQPEQIHHANLIETMDTRTTTNIVALFITLCQLDMAEHLLLKYSSFFKPSELQSLVNKQKEEHKSIYLNAIAQNQVDFGKTLAKDLARAKEAERQLLEQEESGKKGKKKLDKKKNKKKSSSTPTLAQPTS
eukprot:gene10896-12699_t